MASNEYNPSDLTSVLRTLSSLTSPASSTSSNNPNPTAPIYGNENNDGSNANANINVNNNAYSVADNTNTNTSDNDDDQYEPSDTIIPPPTATAAATATKTHILPSHSQHTNKTTSSSQIPTHNPSITSRTSGTSTGTGTGTDPSTITTWSAALRYIMQTVSQNETLQQRIRRLIKNQHDHERQWWQGREALVKKQEGRGEKKKELDRVLNAVGIPIDPTKEVSTTEENKTELNIYDQKVHRASVQMAQSMTLELRGLGIPFFAIKRGLVFGSAKENGRGESFGEQQQKPPQLQLQLQQMLAREDLVTFQRRMLELLQDLCRGED